MRIIQTGISSSSPIGAVNSGFRICQCQNFVIGSDGYYISLTHGDCADFRFLGR